VGSDLRFNRSRRASSEIALAVTAGYKTAFRETRKINSGRRRGDERSNGQNISHLECGSWKEKTPDASPNLEDLAALSRPWFSSFPQEAGLACNHPVT